jgi:hypothetical protein
MNRLVQVPKVAVQVAVVHATIKLSIGVNVLFVTSIVPTSARHVVFNPTLELELFVVVADIRSVHTSIDR